MLFPAVVKLFNALRKQQRGENVASSAPQSKSISKKDNTVSQMSKSTFLDMLKSTSSAKKPAAAGKVCCLSTLCLFLLSCFSLPLLTNQQKGENSTTWDVLKDDYMMGAKLKDWEKEVENEFEQEIEGEFE